MFIKLKKSFYYSEFNGAKLSTDPVEIILNLNHVRKITFPEKVVVTLEVDYENQYSFVMWDFIRALRTGVTSANLVALL